MPGTQRLFNKYQLTILVLMAGKINTREMQRPLNIELVTHDVLK